MSDLLLSLIESIAGAVTNAAENRRSQVEQQPSPQPAPVVRRPPVAGLPAAQSVLRAVEVTAPVRPVRATAPQTAVAVAVAEEPAEAVVSRLDLRELFARSDRLIPALILAEALGPPLALRRPNLWGPPSVLG